MEKGNTCVFAVLLVTVIALSGCAQMRDKFIRKPKEEKKTTLHYQAVRKYDVHPSLELYSKRYVFWKSWNREILSLLRSKNHKKQVVAIEQDVSNLMDMQSMLVDEKAEELQGSIDEMSDIERVIKKEKITLGNRVRIRKELESLGRRIKKDFSYNKMRGFIRDDFKRQRKD